MSLAITFWIYTNRQMFDNVIFDINSPRQIRVSNHLITNIKWSELDYWQHRILFALAVYIMILIFMDARYYQSKIVEKNEVSF